MEIAIIPIKEIKCISAENKLPGDNDWNIDFDWFS